MGEHFGYGLGSTAAVILANMYWYGCNVDTIAVKMIVRCSAAEG